MSDKNKGLHRKMLSLCQKYELNNENSINWIWKDGQGNRKDCRCSWT